MAILNVQGLTKKYTETSGIVDFDLSVDKGDIILLLGPNGAGKTTTFKSILGLIEASSIQLDVLGYSMETDRVKALHHIGAMVSKPAFYDYLTGEQTLVMLKGIYKHVTNERINQIFKDVGLSEAKGKKVGTYSSGMKQRLDLARALVHSPNLLLLDEPFSGMDIEAKHELKHYLKKLQTEYQIGQVISSHMVGDLESFANKVVILYEGFTLFSGDMKDVKASGLTLEEFYLNRIDLYKQKEVHHECA